MCKMRNLSSNRVDYTFACFQDQSSLTPLVFGSIESDPIGFLGFSRDSGFEIG